ncbi:MAG TPA: putative glycoside hydrolase [Terriglobales bacterium]|nr:putative glycoside hydrolase [Terriglobales bacterium]
MASLAGVLCRMTVSSFLLAPPAAAVQNPHGVQLVNVKADTTNPKKHEIPAPVSIVAPPGSEVYEAQRGDSLPSVARKYLKRTKYLTSSELADAIREANHNRQGVFLKSGEQIIIPGILGSPIVEKTVPVARDFEVRAIYLTGVMAGSDHGMRIIRHWREVGGNAVVFDIKDSDGIVNIAFDNPLATGQRHYIPDLPKFTRFLHSQNMHAIARIAIFRDEHLVTTHPELAVQSHSTGKPWRENGKLVWTDPSNPKVQDYDIALAKFVAQSGVDEVQFDYVRFPAEGDQKDAEFKFQSEHLDQAAERSNVDHSKADHSSADRSKTMQRSDVIAHFLDRAYAQIHPTGVLLSLDVFGIMAWQRPVDLSHTGQDIVAMAKHCDVLSPMIYPSHFFGMDGIAHPGDAPEHFIGESMDRFKLITKDSGVVIRPWLQAFAWRTKTYSPKYVEVQIEVAKEKGGVGFLFWNANNDYSKPYAAMPEMRADKGHYFRGDEVGGRVKTEPAAAAPIASNTVPVVPVAGKSVAPGTGVAPTPGAETTPAAAPSPSNTDPAHPAQRIWRH